MFELRAGVPSIYQSTCQTPTGDCVCCYISFFFPTSQRINVKNRSVFFYFLFFNQVMDNVVGNGSNFNNAYWEISYIRTYIEEGYASITPTSSSSGTSAADPTSPGVLAPSKTSSSDSLHSTAFSWASFLLLFIPLIELC